MDIIVSGRVWKLGDNIATDYMAPGFALQYPWEELKKYILHIHKAFTEGFKPGDVIVGGKNYGCGSSREEAPANLKRLGVGCVVAESFGRIFFRNSIAIGFPVLACKGVSGIFNEGDRLELNFNNGRVRNLSTGKELKGAPPAPDLINIVKKGGILALLKDENKTSMTANQHER